MVQISLQPIEEQDIQDLLANLLPEDRVEILGMGVSPEWGIRNSVETSIESVAIRGDGELACLFGISDPLPLGAPRPWLLGTPYMRKHPFKILWLSRRIVRRWQEVFPYMTGHVDARHCAAVTWLRWLGARLTLEPTFGPFQRPYYKFEFGEL